MPAAQSTPPISETDFVACPRFTLYTSTAHCRTGCAFAFPNREHGRRILTKLVLLAQSRCAESVAFEDTLDLKDMLLYQRKAALDHR